MKYDWTDPELKRKMEFRLVKPRVLPKFSPAKATKKWKKEKE